MPVRLLLIENQKLVRLGIRSAVADGGDIDIVGEAGDLATGFELYRELQPDVVILGLRFPEGCSIDHLDKYLSGGSKARLIVLADHAGDAEISRALKKGALGYVCKDLDPAELIKAIRAVAAGRRYLPPDIAVILSEHVGLEELTPQRLPCSA